MTRIIFSLILALLGTAGLDARENHTHAASSTSAAPQAPSGADLAAAAAALPALPRENGATRLPLSPAAEAGPGWRPIRGGIVLEGETGPDTEGLNAAYQVATGQPAGASLLVPPGTFRPGDTLVVEATADRNLQLVITLQDARGAAFSLPAVPLRPGNPRRHERSLADASYFAPQSSAPAPDEGTGFDPGTAVMVTLLDISGFMGSDTPDIRWTVKSLRIEAAGAGEEVSR